MTDLLLKIHQFFFGLNDKNTYKGKNFFMWVITNLFARIFEILLFVWLKCKNILNLYSDCNGEVNNQLVVSFTTYPARIDNVWMVVDSIVRQTMRPFVIELWLSEENFPKKELELPLTLMKYKLRGFLDIKWVKEDLKPHKKYFYSFLQHKDKFVVTIDDDLYYRRDMIALLWKIYEKFPNSVCGHRGGIVVPYEKYEKWSISNYALAPSHKNYVTGCGGVLYPVSMFKNNFIFDQNLIKENSLQTDDLWLKAMELIDDIPVTIGDYYCNAPTLPNSKKSALMNMNCNPLHSGNDANWECLDKLFHVNDLVAKKR